jgi:hypothetical protein
MTQGRAIGKHVLVWSAAVVVYVAGLSAAWSASPPHASNDKQKDHGRWAASSNSAPTISGVPDATVLQDRPYGFLPSANDPEGDTLSFRVTNLPRWATFDTSNGRLAGTPSAGDVGLYSDIVISVSDGQASAELPAFAINVVAYAGGTVTLSWMPPTANTDGSPLLDLAGYEIYWGPESGSYSDSFNISNPGITTYMVENLTAGAHYFAIKAISSGRVASDFSNEIVATVNP